MWWAGTARSTTRMRPTSPQDFYQRAGQAARPCRGRRRWRGGRCCIKKGAEPAAGAGTGIWRGSIEVFFGSKGRRALCAAGKPKRRSDARTPMRGSFLDKVRQRVPVATRAEFVGRRRAIQAVLRAFRDGQSGVLIHGMGALGKSSLAARVQNRMPQHASGGDLRALRRACDLRCRFWRRWTRRAGSTRRRRWRETGQGRSRCARPKRWKAGLRARSIRAADAADR